MKENTYDVAVIGSGFAGSLFAMICHRLGRSVILLEKGRHPRFTIGESSTPLTNLMLEELSVKYNLPALTPLAKWGTWQQAYPEVACGLKRGFTFYHHTLGKPDPDDPERNNQLLVAASPNDRIADTHWYRPEFDQLFAKTAQEIGVQYVDEVDLSDVAELEDGVSLGGCKGGERLHVHAKFVVDATGPRGLLHRAFGLPEVPLPDFPVTQALYSHFKNVGSYADCLPVTSDEPPYPIDRAAVHHVFDGGWAWVLQFNNGVTSAGVAATEEAAACLNLAEGAEAWQRLLKLIPTLQEQFSNAVAIRPYTYVPRLSFRSGATAGKHWVQLPFTSGFVDPLLSTGFALTLLGISRLAEAVELHWQSNDFMALVKACADESDRELLATARLIGSLYAAMRHFPVFVALSHLYFTAVIYSETVRRLGKPELASSFLLLDHPYFGKKSMELFSRIKLAKDGDEIQRLTDEIIQAIEPLNLAGLGAQERKNWYPVLAEDLFLNAHKVAATSRDVEALLERAGFTG